VAEDVGSRAEQAGAVGEVRRREGVADREDVRDAVQRAPDEPGDESRDRARADCPERQHRAACAPREQRQDREEERQLEQPLRLDRHCRRAEREEEQKRDRPSLGEPAGGGEERKSQVDRERDVRRAALCLPEELGGGEDEQQRRQQEGRPHASPEQACARADERDEQHGHLDVRRAEVEASARRDDALEQHREPQRIVRPNETERLLAVAVAGNEVGVGPPERRVETRKVERPALREPEVPRVVEPGHRTEGADKDDRGERDETEAGDRHDRVFHERPRGGRGRCVEAPAQAPAQGEAEQAEGRGDHEERDEPDPEPEGREHPERREDRARPDDDRESQVGQRRQDGAAARGNQRIADERRYEVDEQHASDHRIRAR